MKLRRNCLTFIRQANVIELVLKKKVFRLPQHKIELQSYRDGNFRRQIETFFTKNLKLINSNITTLSFKQKIVITWH